MNAHFLYTIKTFFLVFLALVRRDLYVLRSRIVAIGIDSFVVLMVQILVFGYLFPLFGMPHIFIAPLYIGAIVNFVFFLGFGHGLRLIFDLEHNRFLEYQLTLPVPKRWLFASYVTSFAFETILVTLPLLSLGIILLGPHFVLHTPAWAYFICMYILMIIFFVLLFSTFSLWYPFEWFMQCLWPRRLTPLVCFSPVFFTWNSIYTFAPNIAYLLLLNPITYITEGLRSSLLAGSGYYYLPATWCIGILSICIMCCIRLLSIGIKKRLDPV